MPYFLYEQLPIKYKKLPRQEVDFRNNKSALLTFSIRIIKTELNSMGLSYQSKCTFLRLTFLGPHWYIILLDWYCKLVRLHLDVEVFLGNLG